MYYDKEKNKKIPLSVTLATQNESENILDCIRSVSFADEIVVVDDCSDDDTVEKAKSLGAKVINRNSNGSFHENKNIAIEEAKNEWILSLDADEILSQKLSQSIKSAMAKPEYDGYLVDRHNYLFGKQIKSNGWHPDYILRIFKKGTAWWPLEIHDTPKLKNGGNTTVLKGALIHNSYQDLDQYFDKFNKYTSRLAEEYSAHGISMKGLNIPTNLYLRPLYWFFKKYIFMHGYRDGILGLFISFSSALTIYVSYLKLWSSQKLVAHDD